LDKGVFSTFSNFNLLALAVSLAIFSAVEISAITGVVFVLKSIIVSSCANLSESSISTISLGLVSVFLFLKIAFDSVGLKENNSLFSNSAISKNFSPTFPTFLVSALINLPSL